MHYLTQNYIFWGITLYSPFKINRLFFRKVLLAVCLVLVSCLAYSSTLKMQAT
jgi:hypothetical protein